MRGTQTILIVAAFLLAACGKDEPKPAATRPAPPAPPPPAAGVSVFVDEQQVATINSQQVGIWPRLDGLVPMAARRLGTWQAIKVTGTSGKPIEIAQPSATHPDLIPALFPDDKGVPAFGMFDPVELAKKGQPTLRENGVTAVHVVLAKGTGRGENEHHGEGGTADPSQLKLTVKAGKKDHVIEGAQLLALDREPPPGESGGEGKGWKLGTLLAKAGVTKYSRLLLTDIKGVNLNLEKEDLDPKTSIPFVKLNRQGALRFRVYAKQGETWQPTKDLRGLASIEVLE